MATKKILFPAIHRPDRSPSQRFRFEQYQDILKQNGYIVTYSYIISPKDDLYFYQSGYLFQKLRILIKSIFIRVIDVCRAFSHDVIFIQREVHMLGTTFFERLLKLTGKKIIFDFDDAIWMQQPNVKRSLHFLKKPSKTKDIIRMSDVVLAGNTFLYDYAIQFNPNVIAFPTVVDTDYFKKRAVSDKKRDSICIGWSGSHTTINHFKYLEKVLLRLKEKYHEKINIIVFGDAEYEHKQLGVKGIAWSKDIEREILSSFDIGIMPLEENEWERGKCGMKALLYMASEVATIASPVGVNKEIIDHQKDGLLAHSEEEWFSALSLLIENEWMREKIALAGRGKVEKNYAVLSYQQSLLTTLGRLID